MTAKSITILLFLLEDFLYWWLIDLLSIIFIECSYMLLIKILIHKFFTLIARNVFIISYLYQETVDKKVKKSFTIDMYIVT